MSSSPLQLVWLKRDLRLCDHPALTEAARRGPVLPLFVIEPTYWSLADVSARHWQFCRDSLLDLQQALGNRGLPLLIRCGEMRQVLDELKAFYGSFNLWSHEETGNHWTYRRDLQVAAWCREQGISWQELPQNGVVRRLGNRDHWAEHWDRRMQTEILPPPALKAAADWPALQSLPAVPAGSGWQRSLRSFVSRLYWHCHFMQKLEDRPALEWEPIHPLFAELDRSLDTERLQRWADGHTGWPFVDACMRALKARGWINFRMRAMLTSVASYHLWLPWQASGEVLARCFIDYEPGIHWSQIQMQSGTTGINAIRVYNPLKQGLDLDPDGRFIRRWVPELSDVPLSALHEPRLLRHAQYPAPLVDLNIAARSAKDKVAAIHHHPRFDELSRAVYQQLGSRKGASRSRGRRRSGPRKATSPAPAPQLNLWD